MPALDGLRGLAIALVLLHNLCLVGDGGGRALRLFDTVMTVGWVGVQLFFVLSGFLITGILLDDRSRPGYFRAFFARRVLRIFPLYYLALVLYFLVLPVLVHLPAALTRSFDHQVWYWLYLSNWVAPLQRGVPALPHFWSLAVEEQFYLAWPLVVYFASGRRLARLCVGLVLMAITVRAGVRLAGLSPEIAYENTFARVDALALGGLAAVVARDEEWLAWLLPRRRKAWAWIGALAVALPLGSHGIARTGLFVQTVGYTLLAAVFTMVVFGAAIAPALEDGLESRLARGLSAAPLQWLGKYSYGIYVFHIPVRDLALHWLGGEKALGRGSPGHQMLVVLAFALVVAGASSAAALLSFNLFERHFLALKSKLSPKRA